MGEPKLSKKKPVTAQEIANDPKEREKIVAQVLQEIRFARNYKQGKVKNWLINENLYYGRKTAPQESRSNVDLGQMQSHVHTIMAKIDNPLIFKFLKRKKSQLMRVERLNALRQYDQKRDNWDIKDIAGKKQCVIYGRAVYSYFADSIAGKYAPHLGNTDVYDFLIDPSAGGLDMEQADYLGDYGVSFTKEELEDGIASGRFLKKETNDLITGTVGNVPQLTQEETNKLNRTRDQNTVAPFKEISGANKFKFWRWGTTYKSKRFYLIITEKGGVAIELQPLEEVKSDGLWWYWSYAAFPDLTEFWTPSFCDYVREIFMAQAATVNQGLDNSEQINKPQKFVNVGAVKNKAQLKYRREGIVDVGKDFDITKAVQFMRPPEIETPMKIFELLDGIANKNSGVTAGDQGGAENNEDSKATIYEGNQANSADRYGYFNKSYSFGYGRFAQLYVGGVKDNLIKKISIDILGPEGIDIEDVSKSDIFWKNDEFGIMTESSNAELDLSTKDKSLKMNFLQAESINPNTVLNPKKNVEMRAALVGFKEEEIRDLLDTSDFGDAELMAAAEADMERILDGQIIPPNPMATTAYKQRIVTYMQKNQYKLSTLEFAALVKYVNQLQPIIIKNMVAAANATLLKQSLRNSAAAPGGGSNGEQPQEPEEQPEEQAAPTGSEPGATPLPGQQ